MFAASPFLGSIIDAQTGREWSAQELHSASAQRTSVLTAAGIGRDARVAVYHGGSAAFFADLFAVWEIGACAVCLNPGLTPEELVNVSAFIEPAAILVSSGAATGLPAGVRSFCLAEEAAKPRRGAAGPGARLDDPALMLLTSGTTGTPKLVVHSFRSILARVALNALFIGRADLARTLCVLPTHFGHGLIGNCLTPLLAGQTLVLAGGDGLSAAREVSRLIDQHAVTFLSSVPAFWKLATRIAGSPTAGTLKRLHVGSAPLSSDLWRQVIEWSRTRNVVNMYGITETANWVAGASALDREPQDGAIGTPWGGWTAIRREDGTIAAYGDGELVVQGPSVMSGYYRRADLTEAVLAGGWYRTGDTGHIDESGYAYLTGRRKFEINRAGIKVQPEDIDLLIERHDSVREACAFGIPDKAAGETVAVAVCPNERATFDIETLKKWCGERLTREKLPARWFVVDEIPKTDRGKINRDIVAKHCLSLPN